MYQDKDFFMVIQALIWGIYSLKSYLHNQLFEIRHYLSPILQIESYPLLGALLRW